jgi:hypothetical protein
LASLIAEEQVREISAPQRAAGLTHGKTWVLAGVDLTSLALAYALTYALAAQFGHLPPVFAPSWFLALLAVLAVPAWLAVFAGYRLYEHDNLKISVASFDEVRDVFHAMLGRAVWGTWVGAGGWSSGGW